MKGTVLIAGASGLVGAAAVESFLADGYDVIALSRRRPEVDSIRSFTHSALDLRDAAACRDAAEEFGAVTHVVYTAVFELPGLVPGWSEKIQMETNLAMLRNLMDPLSQSAGGLKHVSLLQGTKAYGVHLHPIRIPARERFPRDAHENFYWLQEDYVRAKSAREGWAFTIWRPQLIVGPNYGVVMNLPPIIGAFAAICREEGRSFGFPGGASWVWEAVDTRLVADALLWGATAANAKGETFNLTNGEVFEWRDLWPSFAEVLGVRLGPDLPVRLAEFLPAKASVWDRIVAKHKLRNVPMSELVGESHHYADFCFAHGATSSPRPAFVSTVKIKQAGFGQVYDTEETFRHWLRKLIERKILPPANA
jgi:nucleoside-diphosphate-sugar epimerase